MKTSRPTCGADSCLSLKGLEADIVSIVYQCTPTLAPLMSAWRRRLVLNEPAWELRLFGKTSAMGEGLRPSSPSSSKNATAEESTKEGMVR